MSRSQRTPGFPPAPYHFRDRSSFAAWQIYPLIVGELSTSRAAAAEQAPHVVMGLVVEARGVAGPGPSDANRVR